MYLFPLCYLFSLSYLLFVRTVLTIWHDRTTTTCTCTHTTRSTTSSTTVTRPSCPASSPPKDPAGLCDDANDSVIRLKYTHYTHIHEQFYRITIAFKLATFPYLQPKITIFFSIIIAVYSVYILGIYGT